MSDAGLFSGYRLFDLSIPDAKLQTITAANKVANSATTATASNTNNAIVARDAAGSFNATMIALTGTPTNGSDVVTKAFVEALASGFITKDSVVAASVANVGTLSGAQTIDGVALVAGNRVLLKNQTTPSQNGVWVVAAGAWTRATDFDGNPTGEVKGGSRVWVDQGTANADTAWAVTNNGTVNVGTDAINFTQVDGAGTVTAGAGLTGSGNTIDVAAADGTIVVNANSIQVGQISNANVAAAAAIAYSKLALTSSIVNADIAPAAAIAYSKLNLTASITNADIAAAAGIVDTKLATISTPGKVANSATTGTASPTASTLALRDAAGRTQFADPAANQDAATKIYVDNKEIRNETPTGTIDGVNLVFTLAQAPAAGTLTLVLSSLELLAGTHFNLAGSTITFVSPFQPVSGEWLRAHYRKA